MEQSCNGIKLKTEFSKVCNAGPLLTCAGGKVGIPGREKSSNNSEEDTDCRNEAPSWGNIPCKEFSAEEDKRLVFRDLKASPSQWESCKQKKLCFIHMGAATIVSGGTCPPTFHNHSLRTSKRHKKRTASQYRGHLHGYIHLKGTVMKG